MFGGLKKALPMGACGLLALAFLAAPGGASALTNGSITHIKVNGQFASVLLVDPASGGTNGGMTVSRDQVAGTSAVDFSWGMPDPTTPDTVILTEGSGPIPNSAFTITTNPHGITAHFAATVSNSADFQILRCVINSITGDFTCATDTPKSFDLTWVTDGLDTTTESTDRVEIMGPVTTHFKGSFTTKSAKVSGTWDGHTSVDNGGQLLDTHSTTATRDVTVAQQ